MSILSYSYIDSLYHSLSNSFEQGTSISSLENPTYNSPAPIISAQIQNSLSPGALQIFQIDGLKVASDFNYKFLGKINPKIVDHTKNMAANESNRKLDIVGDTTMPPSVRLHELFTVVGGKRKDTSNFNFTPIPKEFNESYGIGEQDSNLIMYHRQTITNGTFIDNEDTGEITTIYIRGIKNPEEGADSPIYAVPGYFDGRKDWSEEEVVEKAIEEGWFDLYPSDNTEAGHKRRVGKLKKIINKDGETLQKIEKTIQLGINGNLYPDIIESKSSTGSKTSTIKSHHNVGGLPKKMNLKLVEPLKEFSELFAPEHLNCIFVELVGTLL